ncbi:MAG TPA: DUF5690 family protein [Sphingomonadaceae bacterium]|nr:DUF5690 family protein [Sphingomonadaceae bacterium]
MIFLLHPASSGSGSGPGRKAALILGGIAAFSAYFAMYAFRKPFAAATFADHGSILGGLDYKTVLLIAQVLGYALSKLIGIRVIAEFGRRGRALAILGLIVTSWVALLLFAIIPAPWNVACMFLNGLPLGMIWGLVFSYVEGRRVSEVLGAVLCASFIISSGAVKSVAVLVMGWGVSEAWMPAITGALFFPLLLVSLVLLERMPPPDEHDEAERTVRVPMLRQDRAAFLRNYGLAMVLLVSGYVLLTAMRDFRDNFAAELWTAMGYGGVASVFSASELPVAVVALAALGALMLIRDNMRALLAMHAIIFAGAVLLGLSTLAFQMGLLSPLPYMILTGAGLYFAYTPFNAMLFDRMIAAIGHAGNAGFLIYIADSSGYVGSVALLLYRSFAAPTMDWLPFYIDCAYWTAGAVALLTLCSALYFHLRLAKRHAHVTAAA